MELVARIVTVDEAGIVVDAVYRPFTVIEPAVAVQLTAVFEVNCCVPPNVTVAAEGLTVTSGRACNVTVA